MLAEKRMVVFIHTAQIRCPHKGKSLEWDPARCCGGRRHSAPLLHASRVRLVFFVPALAPARCLVVSKINTVHQSFSFCFPGTALSMGPQLFHPESCCQCQGKDQRREDTLHWGVPTSFPWDATPFSLPELLRYVKACCKAGDAN